MSLLSSLATTDDVSIKNETDSVGGNGPVESGLYPLTVDMAYLEKKKSGALFLNFHFKMDDGREYRENLCIQSGDAKGNKNYYENQQGERYFLPGFNHANAISLLTIGKELAELVTTTKTIKLYNYDAKAEVPTDVEVVEPLLGQRVIAGIQKQIVDKQQRGDDGVYRNTGETREINEIDKIFRERDKMTTAEIRAQAEAPEFYHIWDKKWTGVTRNKASAANDANGGMAGVPKVGGAIGGNTKPKTSLFG